MKTIINVLQDLHQQDTINLRRKTTQSYSSRLLGFYDWLKNNNLDKIPIQDFTSQHARAFLSELKLNTETRKSYQRTLSKYFNILIADEILTNNPFQKIRLPKSTYDHRKRAFKRNEQLLIKAYCQENKLAELWLFIEFMFYTLIRPNELRNLKNRDIDFEKGAIWIKGEFSKNRRTQSIIIPNHFQEILKKALTGKNPDKYIFGEHKTRGVNYFNRYHNLMLKDLGIYHQDTSLYSWKHTGAVAYYIASKDIQGLCRQCRHSSIEITQRYIESISHYDNPEIRNNYPTL